MADPPPKPPPAMPPHVDDSVQAVARLHADHADRASWTDRAFARGSRTLADPRFIACSLVAVGGWIGLNLAARRLGWHPFDPLPFDLLQGVVTLVALYATILIVAAQRRDDELAARREQLSLQLAILNDRKLGKLIDLMEELRRDHPDLRDRVDAEADAMIQPSDPGAILDAMRDG